MIYLIGNVQNGQIHNIMHRDSTDGDNMQVSGCRGQGVGIGSRKGIPGSNFTNFEILGGVFKNSVSSAEGIIMSTYCGDSVGQHNKVSDMKHIQ